MRHFETDKASSKLIGMLPTLVLREICAICTAIRAFIAGKWALARMSTLVCGKKKTSRKSFPAFVAGKWTLAGMSSHVQLEIAVLSTSMPTFIAHERARGMCTLVRSENGVFCASEVAFVARESILNFRLWRSGRRRHLASGGVNALVCLEIVAS